MGSTSAQLDPRAHITKEALADLFDDAFGSWQAKPPTQDDLRQTPRIAVEGCKPLLVVSYTHEGRRTELWQQARILDISADGMGVVLAEGPPVGATLQFCFHDESGARSDGIASVMRVASHEDGYHVGLVFSESAGTLDMEIRDEIRPHAHPIGGLLQQ